MALSRLVAVGKLCKFSYFLGGGRTIYWGVNLKHAPTLVFLNNFCGSCTAYISILSTLDDMIDGSMT